MGETTQINSSFVIGEAISTGWKFTKKYFWVVLGLLAIAGLPSVIEQIAVLSIQQIPGTTSMVMDPISNMPTKEFVGIWSVIMGILSIVVGIVGAWFGLGLIKGYFEILDDKKPAFSIISSASRIHLVRLIGASILAGIAILVGFVALILPGIWIAVRLSLLQYYIIEGYGIMDSIKASWAATKDNFWKLIGIGFVYMGIMILGTLALFVGLLWAIPTIALAQAYVYKKLKVNTPSDIKPIEG